MESIFLDIGIIIMLAGMGAYIARILRQPLIPAYILMGILLGPVFHLITDKTIIASLSEIGIAFLLFSVGLELNLKKLKEIGSVASIGGLIHMGLLFSISYVLFKVIGYNTISSVYVGLILMFSSTLVVVKLLSDKNELDTLHGRIIIGILLMQDIVAIIALSLLNSVGSSMIGPVLIMFIKGLVVFFLGLGLAKMVFSAVFRFAARSDELLFIFSIMIMFFFAIVYYYIGFSIVIGAFIAGLLLGSLPYNVEIISEIKGLKEFFSVIFFVSIGLALIPVNFGKLMLPLLIMLGVNIIALPIITMLILALFGYKKKTAFLTSISLAQISEFGLILATIGFNKGHINADIFSMVIVIAIVTIAFTAYFIKFEDKLYQLLGRHITFFERLSKTNKELTSLNYAEAGTRHSVVLIGYDRIGYSILQKIKAMKKRVVVVDINPDVIKKLIIQHISCMYGDIGDSEIISRLKIERVELVISTVPNHQDSLMLIKKVREFNPDATIIVTSYNVENALELYKKGADYVIVPHFLGGEHIYFILDDLTGSLKKQLNIKMKHIKELEARKERHPHHK